MYQVSGNSLILAYSDLCVAFPIGCLPDHEITQTHKQHSVRIMAIDKGALQQWNLKRRQGVYA